MFINLASEMCLYFVVDILVLVPQHNYLSCYIRRWACTVNIVWGNDLLVITLDNWIMFPPAWMLTQPAKLGMNIVDLWVHLASRVTWGTYIGPVHMMFSVHDPGKTFSEQVLGTQALRLRALWNVLGTPSFRFKIGTHLDLRSMTYCVYTA